MTTNILFLLLLQILLRTSPIIAMAKSYTRPGVIAAVRLLQHTEKESSTVSTNPLLPQLWESIDSTYSEMILEKGGSSLQTLDHTLTNLSKLILQRTKTNTNKNINNNDTYITKEELLQVVAWKFAKGKPRNALKKLLHSNEETLVQSSSKAAFRSASILLQESKHPEIDVTKYIQQAMTELCALRGVGPATASAILCLYCPAYFSFMDDEVIECLYPCKRGYTMKIYQIVNSKCRELADILGVGWTPYRVGRTLWTASRTCASNGKDLTLSLKDLPNHISNARTSSSSKHVNKDSTRIRSSKRRKRSN